MGWEGGVTGEEGDGPSASDSQESGPTETGTGTGTGTETGLGLGLVVATYGYDQRRSGEWRPAGVGGAEAGGRGRAGFKLADMLIDSGQLRLTDFSRGRQLIRFVLLPDCLRFLHAAGPAWAGPARLSPKININSRLPFSTLLHIAVSSLSLSSPSTYGHSQRRLLYTWRAVSLPCP